MREVLEQKRIPSTKFSKTPFFQLDNESSSNDTDYSSSKRRQTERIKNLRRGKRREEKEWINPRWGEEEEEGSFLLILFNRAVVKKY